MTFDQLIAAFEALCAGRSIQFTPAQDKFARVIFKAMTDDPDVARFIIGAGTGKTFAMKQICDIGRRAFMSDTKLCDVPGCNQTIRFVQVTRPRPDGTIAQGWMAVNVTPSKPSAQLRGANVFVFGGGNGVVIPDDNADAYYRRGDHLYVPHERTCFDPNWRRLRKARDVDAQRAEG